MRTSSLKDPISIGNSLFCYNLFHISNVFFDQEHNLDLVTPGAPLKTFCSRLLLTHDYTSLHFLSRQLFFSLLQLLTPFAVVPDAVPVLDKNKRDPGHRQADEAKQTGRPMHAKIFVHWDRGERERCSEYAA